ncbi:MAG: F-type H+-transporting ATPase subunit a [Myxococcales bacterium]|jgi:F-type H+-transporting ATPase subunit a|nr:F-type H+-transporting ATPase subunit a [Myxococcales bacterium]
MGPHVTWFDFLPGYETLKHNLQIYLGREWTWQIFQATHFQIDHIMGALLVVVFLLFGASRYAAAVSGAGDAGLVPPPRFGLRNLFEMLSDTIFGLMVSVMGEKEARRYLPLVGTLFFFILFSNLLALIPGFLPPTDTLKTNLGLSVMVFLLTHIFGVRAHGIKYFKHFLGPLWWLAPLMLPIELISHIARPVSLAMRLLGNIAADHAVVLAFFAVIPFLVPVPFLVMGVFVSVVQAVVFSLLSTVYIGSAVAHEEH